MQSIGGPNSDLGRDAPEVTPVESSETCGGCRLGYDARKAPFVGGTRDNQASISTGSSLKQEAPRKLGTIGLQASEHVRWFSRFRLPVCGNDGDKFAVSRLRLEWPLSCQHRT
jgi:hypothetical protein